MEPVVIGVGHGVSPLEFTGEQPEVHRVRVCVSLVGPGIIGWGLESQVSRLEPKEKDPVPTVEELKLWDQHSMKAAALISAYTADLWPPGCLPLQQAPTSLNSSREFGLGSSWVPHSGGTQPEGSPGRGPHWPSSRGLNLGWGTCVGDPVL